jgi:hypothetical protein
MKKATTTMKKRKSGVEEGKGGDSPSQQIDARIKELSDWRGETLARIRMPRWARVSGPRRPQVSSASREPARLGRASMLCR